MDREKRKRLETAGWKFGDAEDFLGLTEEERQLVELRLAVSRAIRRRREEHHITQKQLAAKLKSSQSRIAKIEAAANDVTLDLSFRALFAAGGQLEDVTPMRQPGERRPRQPRESARKSGRRARKVQPV